MVEPGISANSAPPLGKRKWTKLLLIVILPLLLFACLVKLIALRMEATEWAIVAAVRAGDLVKVRWLLRVRPSLVNTADWNTALGYSSFVARHRSILYSAIEKDDAGMIALLMSKGASPDPADSALAYAVSNGRLRAAEALVRCGAPIDGDALCAAVTHNENDLLAKFLKHGADPNSKSRMGMRALFCAAYRNGVDSMNLLLANGADLHAKGDDGKTALFYASYCEGIAAMKFLLERGVDPNIQDASGATALSSAITMRREHSKPNADFLLAHGAEPNRDPKTLTLAKQWCPSAVETLIAHGAK